MKLFILSPDNQGRIESVLMQNVLCHIPDRTTTMADADAVIVPISHFHDYGFHAALEAVNKPVIIMDMMEYYGMQPHGTHLFGVNEAPSHSENPEWQKFHQWLEANPPALCFKRELFIPDKSDTVIPIEWPCYMPAWDIEPEENFNKRPFEVFYNWGLSNETRPRMHGAIFTLSGEFGYEVISSFQHIDAKKDAPGRKWISIHSPHTHRTHINEIMLRQYQSKLSISMPGAGEKCFRSTEHLLHTVPVKLEDDMAWSFPWVHGENCVALSAIHCRVAESEQWVTRMLEALRWENLHGIYVAAQDLAEKYRIHNYVGNYIMPAITARL